MFIYILLICIDIWWGVKPFHMTTAIKGFLEKCPDSPLMWPVRLYRIFTYLPHSLEQQLLVSKFNFNNLSRLMPNLIYNTTYFITI